METGAYLPYKQPSPVNYRPTSELRFMLQLEDGRKMRILQQKWLADNGIQFEWRDVPLVDEVSAPPAG